MSSFPVKESGLTILLHQLCICYLVCYYSIIKKVRAPVLVLKSQTSNAWSTQTVYSTWIHNAITVRGTLSKSSLNSNYFSGKSVFYRLWRSLFTYCTHFVYLYHQLKVNHEWICGTLSMFGLEKIADIKQAGHWSKVVMRTFYPKDSWPCLITGSNIFYSYNMLIWQRQSSIYGGFFVF